MSPQNNLIKNLKHVEHHHETVRMLSKLIIVLTFEAEHLDVLGDQLCHNVHVACGYWDCIDKYLLEYDPFCGVTHRLYRSLQLYLMGVDVPTVSPAAGALKLHCL